jgi:integrase
MTKAGLTAKQVEHTKPNPAKRVEIPVGLPSGLYLVVQATGRKSWCFRYRWHGRPSKLTFGRYPEVSLSAARAEAHAAIEELKSGNDPVTARAEERGEKTDSVRQAAKEWLEDVKSEMRTWREAQRILEKDVLPGWDRKLIKEIGPRDVKKLHKAISDRGAPIGANRAFETLRNWFNWCVDEGILDASPVKDINYKKRLRNEEDNRDRVLNDAELALVWQASEEMGYPLAPFMHALILTGQRRGEVAGMCWDEIDFRANEWNLPKERTKNGKAHMIPLSSAMLDLLEKVPRFEGQHVFSTTSGVKAINGFSKAKEHLDLAISGLLQKAGKTKPMADWRMHDIRRTMASDMAEAGVPPHVLAAILNHSQKGIQGITSIYNKFKYLPERRQALEDWGKRVLALEKQQAERRAS